MTYDLHKIEIITTVSELESLQIALQAVLQDAMASNVSKELPTHLTSWLGRVSNAISDAKDAEKHFPFGQYNEHGLKSIRV